MEQTELSSNLEKYDVKSSMANISMTKETQETFLDTDSSTDNSKAGKSVFRDTTIRNTIQNSDIGRSSTSSTSVSGYSVSTSSSLPSSITSHKEPDIISDNGRMKMFQDLFPLIRKRKDFSSNSINDESLTLSDQEAMQNKAISPYNELDPCPSGMRVNLKDYFTRVKEMKNTSACSTNDESSLTMTDFGTAKNSNGNSFARSIAKPKKVERKVSFQDYHESFTTPEIKLTKSECLETKKEVTNNNSSILVNSKSNVVKDPHLSSYDTSDDDIDIDFSDIVLDSETSDEESVQYISFRSIGKMRTRHQDGNDKENCRSIRKTFSTQKLANNKNHESSDLLKKEYSRNGCSCFRKKYWIPSYIFIAAILCFSVVKIFDYYEGSRSVMLVGGKIPVQSYVHGEAILKILKTVTTDKTMLTDKTSPQHQAATWIINEAQVYPWDPFLIQRYALATLYYSTTSNKSDTDSSERSDWSKCGHIEISEINSEELQPIEEHVSTSAECGSTVIGSYYRFLSFASECRWYGVTCDSDGRVTKLDIADNNLSGKIPSEIGALIYLSEIDLSRNSLYGSIPNEIGNLVDLFTLNLSHNKLTGSPSKIIGSEVSSKVQDIFLSNNILTGGIPGSLFIPSLRNIDLSGNTFTGEIPSLTSEVTNDGIESSRHLYSINLSRNELSGSIPKTLFSPYDFPNLQRVNLGNNKLSGTIPKFSTSEDSPIGSGGIYSSLKYLDLGINSITGSIPHSLFQMTPSLEYLDLGVNQLDGTIAPEWFDFEYKFSTDIKRSSQPSSNLKDVILWSNKLSGKIPIQIAQLGAQLESLRLSFNELTGRVPHKLCQLRSGSLEDLTVDCAGLNPKVVCECCTFCHE